MPKVIASPPIALGRGFGVAHSWKITLGIVFVAQVFSAMGFSMIFPFLPLYIDALGSSSGLSTELLAGVVISMQGITMMIAAPIWGVVADRFGRKKMILRAMLGGAVVLALMAFAQNAEQLILLRGVQGIISGTVSANNALIAAATPRERIGFAMGTLQVGLWGGVAVGPLLGGVLADLFGYSIPFLITAVLVLVGGLIISFGIREDFKPPENPMPFRPAAMFGGWQQILAVPGVGMVLFMRFLSGLARSIIIPIAPLFVVSLVAQETEASNTYAGMVLAVSSATATFGAVYLGNLGDRISHRKVLFWCAVAAAVLYVPQVFAGDVWQLLLLQGLAGIAAGGLVAAPSALLSRYTDKGASGAVYGLDNSVWSAAKALAPLFGAAIAMWLGMRATFAASVVAFVLIALAAWYLLPADSPDAARKKAD